MKALVTILALCFIVITASITYLIFSGVSLRSAPIIKPSVIASDFKNVSQGLFLRLFPDLQQSEIVLWNLPEDSEEALLTLQGLRKRFELGLKTEVSLTQGEGLPSLEEVKNCPKPCWIVSHKHAVDQLALNPWIEKTLKPLNRNYFSITWVFFQRNLDVLQTCIEEKRLDSDCLKRVSVNEVAKKMKKTDQRYFFMRKYQDYDYFLFIEENKRP